MIKTRASHKLSKCSAAELYPQPFKIKINKNPILALISLCSSGCSEVHGGRMSFGKSVIAKLGHFVQ